MVRPEGGRLRRDGRLPSGGHGAPRPQRCRQDDAPPPRLRAPAALGGERRGARRRPAPGRVSVRTGRAGARGRGGVCPTDRPPVRAALCRPERRGGSGRGHRAGDRDGRVGGSRRPTARGILQRDAPACQGGGGPRVGSRGADPRRAAQRRRPGAASQSHRLVPASRRERADGDRLVTCAVGSGADGRADRGDGRRPSRGRGIGRPPAGGDDRPAPPVQGGGRRPAPPGEAARGGGGSERHPPARRRDRDRSGRRLGAGPGAPPIRPRSAGRATQGGADRRVARERVPVPGGEAMSVLALFRHHVRMLFRRGRLFLVTLLAVTPAGVLLIGGLADADPPTEIAGLVANIGARTFPIVALILASSTLRDERDDGTLPYLYMTPISRPVMAVTSIAAGITVTALVGVVAAAAITVAAAWIGADIGFGVAAFPAYVAAALGYAPLFVPAGYLVPRVILVGLGYVILWEQIVAYLVTGVANTSVWRFALSVYADLVPSGDGDLAGALGPVAPGAGGGVAKVAVVAVVGWALLTWALRRRDAM